MSDNIKEETKDIICTIDYDESNPIFQRIKKEFINKLKEKYQCEDYDSIVNYVFDYVFKKKLEKSKCIENLNPLFNNKANGMIDYLWKLMKSAENEQENDYNPDDKNNYNLYKKGGKQWGEKYKSKGRNTFDNRQKFHKNRQRDRSRERSRERSRSYSKERNDYQNYENYQNYPIQQKGFYPPKGRYGGPMMPMGGGYPPYYAPQMMPLYMNRFKKKFPTKKIPNVTKAEGEEKNEKGNAEDNKEIQEGTQEVINKEENKDGNQATEEQKQNQIDVESFNKMTPEEQKKILEKRVATKKVRCKNWPGFKDPNCIFAHPTETVSFILYFIIFNKNIQCPYFPACTYGDKCCYIHPSIPCKFGFYCTRIGCAYSHPPGFNSGMAMYPNMMQPIPFIKHKSKHQTGTAQEKNVVSPEKNETEQKKDEANPEEKNENQKQEEPIQEEIIS